MAVPGALRPRLGGAARSQRGQALPVALAGSVALLIFILGIAMVGAAVVAKGRAQRGADLIAISAATVLDEQRWRVALPARRADGSVNPVKLSRRQLGAMARRAARTVARRNGIPTTAMAVRLVGFRDWVPNRVRVRIRGRAELTESSDAPVATTATAEAVPAVAEQSATVTATGGGYSGPLVFRHGEGMRPDVARAFDRMARAAARAGQPLAVTSGFRSDAEQAVLFAQNPDPKWVAPPGQSLHRCATELDLGPSSAYPWLAANAGRFGFVRRYSWEPWHFGYVDGPEPCSDPAGRRAGVGSRDRAKGSGRGNGSGRGHGGGRAVGRGDRAIAALPSWVPAAYRGAILRSAAASGVSARLLAAQLSAESGFNPSAVSPAGAQGIAQFMPATARSVGLADPFDPEAAIAAQGRLMSQLIAQFGSPTLALAAYNAGPGAVAACSCVPPYPETRAYVAQITGLLAGAGPETGAWLPSTSVRLVA